jgi:hypothetical protein
MKLHSLIAFTADWLYADFGAAGLDGAVRTLRMNESSESPRFPNAPLDVKKRVSYT